ncbi:MAG TPA: hypothetical protein VH597_05660 [Verrucomicrobiae bacterium]|jgi:hypothetical protein|nr:hypothetical protein [Verrucomicrobiae bacterium]
MSGEPSKSVERLFPFVQKSRTLLVGRDTLRRSKSKLHFVLITTDLSEGSRAQILTDFLHYPIVQKYTSAELETFFGVKGAKVVGFAKSGLAQSIYAEMKDCRINRPVEKPKPAESLPTPPSGQKAS